MRWIVLLFAVAISQVTSAPERAIVSAVDAGNPAALALLETAVNINSGTQNFAGVRRVGDLFRKEFDALGFKTTWVDGRAFKRAGHLVADHPGKGPRTILIGHLDTVFERDSPFQAFKRIDDKTATGPGIIDTKGGDVIIVAAFRRKLAGEEHLTFNPSLILGGTSVELDEVLSRGSASGKTNVIAATATAIGDLRTLSKEQLQHARDAMKAVVADAPLAQTEATLAFDDGYPSLPPTEGNAKLLAEYDRASRDLGFGPVAAVSPDRAGAADVPFLSGEVKSSSDGIGLLG